MEKDVGLMGDPLWHIIAENDFGRRLHPSYGAVQLIEGWEGTKVAGGDLQEENLKEDKEEIYRRSRRRV